jgi:hypothetical protein
MLSTAACCYRSHAQPVRHHGSQVSRRRLPIATLLLVSVADAAMTTVLATFEEVTVVVDAADATVETVVVVDDADATVDVVMSDACQTLRCSATETEHDDAAVVDHHVGVDFGETIHVAAACRRLYALVAHCHHQTDRDIVRLC